MDDSFDVPGEEDESYFFGVMETIFVGWFTFIFIVRFLMAPDKVGLKREDQTKQRNHVLVQLFLKFLEHHRPVWHSSFLHLCFSQHAEFSIFSGVDG